MKSDTNKIIPKVGKFPHSRLVKRDSLVEVNCFNSICRYWDSQTEQTCIVKGDPHSAKENYYLKKEAKMLTRLHHNGPSPFIITPILEGPNFIVLEELGKSVLQVELGSLELKKRAIRELLLALKHCHDRGIIHCDVKPTNVLVNPSISDSDGNADGLDYVVKLIDFDTSVLSTEKDIDVPAQSYDYRSPEIVLGLPYDEKIDIWGAGHVVYNLLFNQDVFDIRNVVESIDSTGSDKSTDVESFNNSLSLLNDFILINQMESVIEPMSEEMIETCEIGILFDNEFNLTRGNLRSKFDNLLVRHEYDDPQMLDFVLNLLRVDPEKRLSVDEALNHSFLK